MNRKIYKINKIKKTVIKAVQIVVQSSTNCREVIYTSSCFGHRVFTNFLYNCNFLLLHFRRLSVLALIDLLHVKLSADFRLTWDSAIAQCKQKVIST